MYLCVYIYIYMQTMPEIVLTKMHMSHWYGRQWNTELLCGTRS
jgi:hypothetical protein